MNKRSKSAFTVLEIIVVTVIIGVIAGFAIPSLKNTMEKNLQRQIRLNIIVIKSAQEIYKAKYGTYFRGLGLTTINANLGINIIPRPNVR